MKVTMKSITDRAHDMVINCMIGRVASVCMGVTGVQITASGIRDIKAGKLLRGCGKVSLGILSTPFAIRSYLAQDVHMDRESILAANMVDSIVNDPNASEKDRELAKSYQTIYMDFGKEEGDISDRPSAEDTEEEKALENKELTDSPESFFYQELVKKVHPQKVAQNFNHVIFNFAATSHKDIYCSIIEKDLIDALYDDGTLRSWDSYFERDVAIQLLNDALKSEYILIKPALMDYTPAGYYGKYYLTTDDMRFLYAYAEISKDGPRDNSKWLYPTLIHFSQWADNEQAWVIQAKHEKASNGLDILSINLYRVPKDEVLNHSDLLQTISAILGKDIEDPAT